MDGGPHWATFRSWPAWVQVLAWLLVWPVLLGLYTLTKPPDRRRGWWVATGASTLLWIGAANGGGSDVDCAGGSGDGPRWQEGPVAVDWAYGDPYDLDRDRDGVGCQA